MLTILPDNHLFFQHFQPFSDHRAILALAVAL
jgi:hypothetical protein